MDIEPMLGDAEDRDPQNNNDFIKVSIAFFSVTLTRDYNLISYNQQASRCFF